MGKPMIPSPRNATFILTSRCLRFCAHEMPRTYPFDQVPNAPYGLDDDQVNDGRIDIDHEIEGAREDEARLAQKIEQGDDRCKRARLDHGDQLIAEGPQGDEEGLRPD